jgi:hypothetical protein
MNLSLPDGRQFRSLSTSLDTQASNLRSRGTTEAEVIEAILTAPWHAAENGRMECRKDYTFNSVWNRRRYATKQVRPVFVDEPNQIVVVTVYVYYF